MLSILFFVGLAIGAPSNGLVLHEENDIVGIGRYGHNSKRLNPEAMLPMRIALTQSNLNKGYEHLMQVSDPQSQDFGKHWTLDAIHEYFAPSEETREAVKSWLENVQRPFPNTGLNIVRSKADNRLAQAGIDRDNISEPTSRGWLGFNVPVSVAESLFHTEYYESRGEAGAMHIGCNKYYVPSHLSTHIDFVTPGIGLYPLAKRHRPVAPSLRPDDNAVLQLDNEKFTNLPCGQLITPACIRELYGIPAAANHTTSNNSTIGIFEFIEEYDQEDLNLFFEHFAPHIPQGTHPTLVSIDGATAPTNNTQDAGGEAVLDFDLAFALLYPQNITLYQVGFTEQQEEYFFNELPGSVLNKEQIAGGIAIVENLLNAVDGSFCTPAARNQSLDCGTTELATVLSVSYGSPEINFPFKFAQRACNEYMKLGLKGHTILFASGDYGPAGNSVPNGTDRAVSNACINTQHPQNVLVNGTIFNPGFPATCPYVLTVGATKLSGNETAADPESVMHIPGNVVNDPSYISFGSSGGFSNYFKEPSYQTSAISTYNAKYKPSYKTYAFPGGQKIGGNGGIYATGGRGFPDVSANGANLGLYTAGALGKEYGTSLATPIWASLITLINNERAAHGKGPVGFVNPTLYQNLQVFNDITSGHAPGCGTKGFAAAPGWDPTTGLGTPKYPELVKVFLALP